MTTRQDTMIGLGYVWIEGDVPPRGGPDQTAPDRDALHSAVAAAILGSPWPLRGVELHWLRCYAEMGATSFARATGMSLPDIVSWEAAEQEALPADADAFIRGRIASLLGMAAEDFPFPCPQRDGDVRHLIARRDPTKCRWSAEMPGARTDAASLVAQAEVSADPLVRGLLSLLRAEEAAAQRARDILAEDLSLLRTGPSHLGFTMETAGRAVAVMAGQMATWLREHGAENYTETEFSHHETPFTLTVQRRTGRTAHQLRQIAEARAASLEAALRAALASLDGEAAVALKEAVGDLLPPVQDAL